MFDRVWDCYCTSTPSLSQHITNNRELDSCLSVFRYCDKIAEDVVNLYLDNTNFCKLYQLTS